MDGGAPRSKKQESWQAAQEHNYRQSLKGAPGVMSTLMGSNFRPLVDKVAYPARLSGKNPVTKYSL